MVIMAFVARNLSRNSSAWMCATARSQCVFPRYPSFNQQHVCRYSQVRRTSTGLVASLFASAGVAGIGALLVSRPSACVKSQTRSVVNSIPVERNTVKLTLYQYSTCPFCCKVRAYLDYYGYKYDTVEVNPLFRSQIKFSSYRKVPILLADGIQLNDSSLIISLLFSHLLGKGLIGELLKFYPALESINEKGKSVTEYQNKYHVMYQEAQETYVGNGAIQEEVKWRKWVDNTFVHTMSPNIYRTIGEAYRSMEYISRVGNFKFYEAFLAQYIGTVAMYFIGKRVKQMHRLKDDVRQSLYEEARTWTKAIGKQKKFMGGERPNLADLTMYGVLSSIEGLDAFKDLLENTSIGPWYYRMKELVDSHAGCATT